MQHVQLDRQRNVIRERGLLDIQDLALRVIRAYAGPLAMAFAIGVVPMMCLNAWLLADYADVDFSQARFVPYMWWMLWLVLWGASMAAFLLRLPEVFYGLI